MSKQEDLSGNFGDGQYFSNLFVQCIELEFSGGVLVWSEADESEGRVFFAQGRPFLCSGDLFVEHRLGEVLVKLGLATLDDVELALRVQASQEEDERLLLGELLMREAYVPEDGIEAALQIQTKKRLFESFSIERGMWRGLWSKRNDIVKKGAVIEPWDVLVPALQARSSETELRDFSDDILGSAVSLTCPIEALERYGANEDHDELLQLLDKPRRPDQIEKQLGRQFTRSLLKALSLAGVLERVPAKKGIPLASARPRRKSSVMPQPDTISDQTPPPRIPTPVPVKVAAIQEYDEKTLELIKKLESMHEKLDDLNYFELLEATPHSSARELRAKYTLLLRDFHPDTLNHKKLSRELLEKAADISSQLNEAFHTLTNDKQRAEYLLVYNDARIGGKVSKKALVDEADKRFKMALILIKKKDHAKAREYLNYAINTVPLDGRYKAYLAWSMWTDSSLLNDVIMPRVIELLAEAVELNEDDPDIHFYYGSVLKMNGEIKKAIKHFKACAEIKPNYTEAVRELRLLRSRSRK